MEPTPLGRAEWIRFQALFFGKEESADSLFWQTVKAYEKIKALTQQVKERPSVVTEKKYGAVWYLPGGKSYMAHFLEDAGATVGKEKMCIRDSLRCPPNPPLFASLNVLSKFLCLKPEPCFGKEV